MSKRFLTIVLVLGLGTIMILTAACSGSEGAQGQSGSVGEQGPTGPAGPEGAGGSQGPAGPAGATGATGAAGKDGATGAQGAIGVSTGTLTGKVTNALTGSPVAGVVATVTSGAGDSMATTSSSGVYSVDLPVGFYTVSFSASGYAGMDSDISVTAGESVAINAVLAPSAAVAVSASSTGDAHPGGSVDLSVSVETFDGSTVSGVSWAQTAGVSASLSGATSESASATLGNEAAYKASLMGHLNTLDRVLVQGINHLSLEEAEHTAFTVTVTTSSGTYTDTVDLMAHLPYEVNPGLQNVPIDKNVLIQGKDQASYSWSITSPSGSSASLTDASGRNPYFKPDVVGEYVLTESVSGATISVFGGTWKGNISGVNADGSLASNDCTVCHDGNIAAAVFEDWSNTGHASIFTDNLNTSTHYGSGCFECHTVGFDTDADNGGFDEASDYEAFLSAGLLNVPSSNNWATVVADFPAAAQLANIQCESCHGPQDGGQHKVLDGSRTSISSDVCAACHGEPLRHARFQQWEESGHANFALAEEEATVEGRGSLAGHCGRCHSGQGFIAWIDGDLTKWIQGADGNATVEEMTAMGMTVDEVQPQTCTTCHDPHTQGLTSGEPNTSTVRLEDNTGMLPSGFSAVGVGRGAICMACHNTRNGAIGDTADDHAPHTAAQADVMMGENAFFVTTGARGGHSLLDDTCATCHMETQDPPAALSYNLGGTNHTFAASEDICATCHGEFTGGTVKEVVEAMVHELEAEIATATEAEIAAQVLLLGSVTIHGYDSEGVAGDTLINGASVFTVDSLTEYHGRSSMNMTINDVTVSNVRITSDTTVGAGSLTTSAAGQLIAKASWNYWLIHGDGSHGIHNPDWVIEVLTATIKAIK